MRANITALRRSLPASHACQLVSFELSFKIHVTSHTEYQDSVNVRAFIPSISISNTPLSRRNYYLLIINQLIN